jgi:acyl-CoA reductase-like NAD-dependent aldehyde dehydrogenase
MRISHTGPEEVDKAAETAAFTSALWRGTSFEERGARLRRLARLIRSQAGDIAELIAR